MKKLRPKHFWNRKYLINPRFQLNLIVPTIAFFFCIFTIFYIINYFFVWKFYSEHATSNLLTNHNTEAIIREYFSTVNTFFISSGIITLVLLITGGIIYTHKVAGPMFRLKRHMLEIANGKHIREIHFRKHDHFHDVAVAYNKQLKKKINEFSITKSILILFCLFINYNTFAFCTINKISNIYYGPSDSKYRIKLPLYKHTPLLKLEKKKQWYKVRDFTKEEGWIKSEKLTHSYLCAIIKVNKTKLYPKIPTKKNMSKNLPEISYYSYTFKVIRSSFNNKWTLITNNTGKEFWVKRKHIWVQ